MIEVRDAKNELLAKKRSDFFRNKKRDIAQIVDGENVDISQTFVQELSKEELAFYTDALSTIADIHQKKYIRNMLEDMDYNSMAQFQYLFWNENSTASITPRQAFANYRQMVDRVEEKYATPLFRGFETDRGRVTLQYGLPNDLLERHKEPDALPYEIWHYYELKGRQRNVKFVFFDDTGVGTDFKLIHSNALNELNNARWREVVFHTNSRYIELEDVEEDLHNRARNREIINDF